MKQIFTLLVLVAFGHGLMGQTYFGPNYVHANHASNCFFDYTVLDGGIIGTNNADNLIFTHVWGLADLSHEAYMPKSHGLWFTGTEWSIFNETQAPIDTNLAFNVLNPKTNGASFSHTVTPANSTLNWSDIDNPLLNNNPTAVFFISKSWANGVYDTAHVGIWYDSGHSKWAIYNEDWTNTLQINSTYNIFVPAAGTSYYKHVATNNYYITYLDNPLLNGNPGAKIFVVHDYTTTSGTQGYINDELGVWWDGSVWTIYNDNPADTLFTGATFNVLIIRDNPVGIANNVPETSKIKITPNPAGEKMAVLLNSSYKKSLKEIRISSMEGQTIMQRNYNGEPNGEMVFDVSGLTQGLYIVTAVSGEGNLSVKLNIAR